MICSNYLLRQCARLSVLLILAMTPVFQSCSSDNIVEPELETGNALVEINSVVEILLERGFDVCVAADATAATGRPRLRRCWS